MFYSFSLDSRSLLRSLQDPSEMASPSERISKLKLTTGFSHILFMGQKSIDRGIFFLVRQLKLTAILFCTKFSAKADCNFIIILYSRLLFRSLQDPSEMVSPSERNRNHRN